MGASLLFSGTLRKEEEGVTLHLVPSRGVTLHLVPSRPSPRCHPNRNCLVQLLGGTHGTSNLTLHCFRAREVRCSKRLRCNRWSRLRH